MGVTGATGTLSAGLPELLKRIKQYSGNVPAAVGFGVSTREHFLSVASIADGVVIGSQIITTLSQAAPGERAKAAEKYCAEICGRKISSVSREAGLLNGTQEPNGIVHLNDTATSSSSQPELLDQIDAANPEEQDPELFSARFGEFGGMPPNH